MPNKTENYQLNQWEPSDPFLRTDFNEDNAKLDAAITEAAKPPYVVGSYQGDYTSSRLISVGFTPSAVFSLSNNGLAGTSSGVYGGLALPNKPVTCESGTALEITEGGFQVYYKNVAGSLLLTNISGITYYYIAFR